MSAVNTCDVLLRKGTEEEIYPGEIKDIVLSALSNALRTIPENSRSADVIKDIIENNDYEELGKSHADRVKAIMKGYTGMTRKIRTSFEELGFVFTTHKTHVNAYYGDKRYRVTFAATPSDIRTGKNLASDIIKICF